MRFPYDFFCVCVCVCLKREFCFVWIFHFSVFRSSATEARLLATNFDVVFGVNNEEAYNRLKEEIVVEEEGGAESDDDHNSSLVGVEQINTDNVI